MAAILQNIVDLATEMLTDEFGTSNVEVNMVQTYYLPTKQQTIFLVVAKVGNVIATGKGESTGKAVNNLIVNLKQKEANQ